MFKFDSNQKYDLLIVCHEKDYNNLKYVVQCVTKNLDFDSLHLIISERENYDTEILKSICDRPIYKHFETDVLSVDKTKISFRPNWIYQQLLKLFQNVTKNENYLIIDSDCLILKHLDFFKDEKQIFYFTRDQNHQPYFNFMSKILKFGKSYHYSFISEIMMMNKKIINKLLKDLNCNSVEDFLNLVYENTTHDSYLSEFELYGSFFFKNYSEFFCEKFLNYEMLGKNNQSFTDEEIQSILINTKNLELCTIHHWL